MRGCILGLSRAAAAVVFCGASTLLAQYQVDNSTGRARDANNRLGSGGYNDTRALPNGVTSDDIVYGNVTRGMDFRGRLTSTDPRAFRGELPGKNTDDFIRDSSGVSAPGATPPDPFQPQRYFGDSRGVAPPSGFERDSFSTGGFVPAAPPSGPTPGDLRLTAVITNPVLQDSLLTGSTASDVSRLKGLSPIAASLWPSLNPANAGIPGATPDTNLSTELTEMARGTMRRLNITGETLRSMREELQTTAGEEELPGTAAGNPPAAGAGAAPAAPETLTAPENPANGPLQSRLHARVNAPSLSGSLETSTGMRQNLLVPLPTAALQSAQYAELRRRLKTYQEQGALTDDQVAAQEYNEQLRLQQQQPQEGKPVGTVTPAATPPGKEPAAAVKPGAAAPVPLPHEGRRATVLRGRTQPGESGPGMVGKPEGPMRITSFAEGIKAPRLKAMLEGAESAMREGKFTNALDQYDAAAAVAPNNPIILMGRANAELGAAYYARAEAHIEQIFASDQAMLLAQYDLRRFFGEERLQYLVRDLKDVAKSEPNQSRPLFLLAYIAYNTNSPQLAADYLAAAEQRGGTSPMYGKLREFWHLPQPQTAPHK